MDGEMERQMDGEMTYYERIFESCVVSSRRELERRGGVLLGWWCGQRSDYKIEKIAMGELGKRSLVCREFAGQIYLEVGDRSEKQREDMASHIRFLPFEMLVSRV